MSQKEDKYPEIKALKSFCNKMNCSVRIVDSSYKIHPYLSPISLIIDGIDLTIHVQDEYNDLKLNNSLLTMILCLQELELIEDSTDYLNWIQFQGIKKSTEKLRSYYQNIVAIMPKLRPKFSDNSITSFVSDLDYQLNSNSVYYLRKKIIQ